MAAALGAAVDIIVVDIVPSRLRLAEEVGATAPSTRDASDVHDAVLPAPSGRGAEYAIDATGVVAVLETALAVLAPSGRWPRSGHLHPAPPSPSTSTSC